MHRKAQVHTYIVRICIHTKLHAYITGSNHTKNVWVYTHIYTHTYIHTYISQGKSHQECMGIHTHIHTHIHTYISQGKSHQDQHDALTQIFSNNEPGGYMEPKGGWERWINGQMPDLNAGTDTLATMFNENQLSVGMDPLDGSRMGGRGDGDPSGQNQGPSHIVVRHVFSYRVFVACLCVCVCAFGY
jgi:hypothetical protein